MIEKNQLCKFLVNAKKATYAAGDKAIKIVENDHSTSLTFVDGDLEYHDNYFGGEPFGGREVVFFQNQPIYLMVYYGWVDKLVLNFGDIYKVLWTALLLIPEEHPFRGPDEYIKGSLIYRNAHTGGIDNFAGKETISSVDGKEMYEAKYIGGFVNQKK